jgi:hypothetical protein
VSRQDPGWLRVYWPVLLLAGVPILFGIPQGLALVWPGVGGTASEWTRDVLGVTDGPTARFWVFLALWSTLAVWFPIHVLKGWWYERPRRRNE